MITLPDIDALELVGVYDRGVANKERIMVRALKATEMAQYGIILAFNSVGPASPSSPFNDHFFWFGDGIVQKDEIIFVYTGVGEPRKTTVGLSQQTAYSVHWNKGMTLFANSSVVPVIIAFGQILVAAPPMNALQTPSIEKTRTLSELLKLGSKKNE